MEIKFVINPYTNYPYIKIEWYVFLEEDEIQFQEEIKQEMDLNLSEQHPGRKLW